MGSWLDISRPMRRQEIARCGVSWFSDAGLVSLDDDR